MCGTSSLWATLDCAALGPSPSCGEEPHYNIQRAEVKLSVKNSENVHCCIFKKKIFDFFWLLSHLW